MGAAFRTALLCAMGLVAGVTMLVTVLLASQDAQRAAGQLDRRTLIAYAALQDTSSATWRRELAVDTAIRSRDGHTREAAINQEQLSSDEQTGSWVTYLSRTLNLPGEVALQQPFASSSKRLQQVSASLVLSNPGSPVYKAGLLAAQSELRRQQSLLKQIESTVYLPVIRREVAATRSGIAATRSAAVISYGVLSTFFAFVGVWLMRGARRDQRLLISEAAALKSAAQHADFERSLQRGLEMEPSEESTYDIIGQALSVVAGQAQTEVLLADSSQSHFRRVAANDHIGDMACRVGSPLQCAAASSGQTRVFNDSSLLDTCPFLRGRDDRVWAICTPVNVAGHTVGVTHAQNHIENPPGVELGTDLELIARKVGDRIGVLRVLSITQTQAQVDPLTGLPNRRTLENQVGELVEDQAPFVVAFADLDHFKRINDSQGHATGDRAIRLFARVLRDSIRPQDLVARFGGEEFVAVFPCCSLIEGHAIAERIRSRLTDALAHASVASFTVTIGLAGTESIREFAEVVGRADAAMLKGKKLGRDRVFTDSDVADSHPPDQVIEDNGY
jgi:diguanylate cyclase (GGDEF)-like protein